MSWSVFAPLLPPIHKLELPMANGILLSSYGRLVIKGEEEYANPAILPSQNHVNNVTYIRYAESARINWAYNYAIHHDPSNRTSWSELWTPRGDGLILRSMKTDYKFPMTWPDKISVFHKLRYLPKPEDTSFVLDVVILSEGQRRVAARCEEDIVVYDYKRGEKIAIREFMMRAFEKTWRDQREEEERVRRRVEEVEGVVRELERGCWDKEGAVEDMGGGR